jgi:hypothetical protein
MQQLVVVPQSFPHTYIVHNGRGNSYWYVQTLSTGRISVMSMYYRGEGYGKQHCVRDLPTGKTREKVLAAIQAQKGATK